MIKTIHFINVAAVTVTIVFYCYEPIYGLITQAFLGGFQILLALITAFKYENEKYVEFKKLIKRYWTLILIAILNATLLFFSTLIGYTSKTYVIITFCIIPMLIACYFVYVTYTVNKNYKKIQS